MPDHSTPLHGFEDTDFVWNREYILETLRSAADTFVQKEKSFDQAQDKVEIWAASKDWFLEEWGRDTFIALPGILLVTNRYKDAASVFRHFARFERNGLLPNRIRTNNVEYNTADGTMWFVHALKQYIDATQDWPLVQELFPVLQSVMHGYEHGTSYERGGESLNIKMDTDCLIVSPKQATWMDADPSENNSQVVTPRNGKTVEINGLWYANLRWMAVVCDHCNTDGSRYASMADAIQEIYQQKFWHAENQCLYDVIEGDPHGHAIRPNQIITLSVAPDLLDASAQGRILDVVTEHLLTPGGLRSLSLQDAAYRGEYNTDAPMSEKDLAYHQGTVWPWLIGPYCDALAAQGREEEIQRILIPLIRFCIESPHRSIPEVFAGDAPHQPGGTTSQAWSVAEVMRVVDTYL